MRRSTKRIDRIATAITHAFLVLVLAGCSGGSSGAGSSTVNVSLALTEPNAAPDNVGTLSSRQMVVEQLAASPASDNIDHVWITVQRVSLIPGAKAPGPDPNGELTVQDTAPPDAAGHIVADLDASEEVDLRNLPAGGLALFLDAIPGVPAGTYGKIRLYYTDPKVHFIGATDNTIVHGTANYHLDIHFTGGKLVIPESTGGGVQIHDVAVVFVLGKEGLKVTVGPNNILMRPQVFATVSTVRYVLTGTVENVDKSSSTFDLSTGDLSTGGVRNFQVAYDNVFTRWSFRESGDAPRAVAIDNNAFAIAALDNGAIVSVIGTFSAGGLFLADDATITFPVSRVGVVDSGTVSSGWVIDTFALALPIDNLVIPKPSREGARYDDNTTLFPLAAGDAAIVKGVVVTARGYAVAGGTEAFWISVGP